MPGIGSRPGRTSPASRTPRPTMGQSMREEHRHGPGLERHLGSPAQQPELEQPLRDHERGGAVNVSELRPGEAATGGNRAGSLDKLVQRRPART